MNVTQYTFQSPSTMQVQVGTPVKSAEPVETPSQSNEQLPKEVNKSLTDAKNFQTSQTQEVTPSVDSKYSLDIYA